jgi:hypothetical protein
MLPPSILVWVAGLWFLLRDAAAKRYRALGWAFLVLMGTMIALHGKTYYMAPAYPMLFAAGGVFWERRPPAGGCASPCRPCWWRWA